MNMSGERTALLYWREWAEAQPEYPQIATTTGIEKINERWWRQSEKTDKQQLDAVREAARKSMPKFVDLDWLDPKDEYNEASITYNAIFRLRVLNSL